MYKVFWSLYLCLSQDSPLCIKVEGLYPVLSTFASVYRFSHLEYFIVKLAICAVPVKQHCVEQRGHL